MQRAYELSLWFQHCRRGSDVADPVAMSIDATPLPSPPLPSRADLRLSSVIRGRSAIFCSTEMGLLHRRETRTALVEATAENSSEAEIKASQIRF